MTEIAGPTEALAHALVAAAARRFREIPPPDWTDYIGEAEILLGALPAGWRLTDEPEEEPGSPIELAPLATYRLVDIDVIDGRAELPDGRIIEAEPGVQTIRIAIVEPGPEPRLEPTPDRLDYPALRAAAFRRSQEPQP